MPQGKVCKIEGCTQLIYRKGMCNKHRIRVARHGDPFYAPIDYHGMSKIPEYYIWKLIKARCFHEANPAYRYYGGRGITMCDFWKESFRVFFQDMGPRPFLKAEIDRINNDGNYEPGNCRWVTRAENNRNSRNCKLTWDDVKEIRRLFKDESLTRKQLQEQFSVSASTIQEIITHKAWWKEDAK